MYSKETIKKAVFNLSKEIFSIANIQGYDGKSLFDTVKMETEINKIYYAEEWFIKSTFFTLPDVGGTMGWIREDEENAEMYLFYF